MNENQAQQNINIHVCPNIFNTISVRHIECLKNLTNEITINEVCANILFYSRTTPLYTACLTDYIEGVEFLVNEEKKYGNPTKLTRVLFSICGGFCVSSNSPRILKILFDNGYDPYVMDTSGNTLLHSAVEGFTLTSRYNPFRIEIVKLLLEKGVDQTITNKRSEFAIDYITIFTQGGSELKKLLSLYELPEIKEVDLEFYSNL